MRLSGSRKSWELPASAGSAEIEARITELRDKEEELEALRGQWEAREKAELKMSQWQALYKSEDWLGCWIGLGIIAAATLYFAFTGLSFKAPAFRWTTDGEFQGHIAVMAPVVERLAQQAGDKGEAALQEAAQALQTAIAAKDRKAAGAAAKKLEAAAKQAKDKDLKKRAEGVGKDIGSQAGRLPDKVVSSDNFKYSFISSWPTWSSASSAWP